MVAISRLVGRLLLPLVSACVVPRAETGPVSLEVVRTFAGVGLRLHGAAGVKIGARVKPTLELDDGARITFDARLTPDSAYFAEAPHADLLAARGRVTGTLRVGVCQNDEKFCRALTLAVDEAIPK